MIMITFEKHHFLLGYQGQEEIIEVTRKNPEGEREETRRKKGEGNHDDRQLLWDTF